MWNIIRSAHLFYFYLPSLLICCAAGVNTEACILIFFLPPVQYVSLFFFPLKGEGFLTRGGSATHLMAALRRKFSWGTTRASGDER